MNFIKISRKAYACGIFFKLFTKLYYLNVIKTTIFLKDLNDFNDEFISSIEKLAHMLNGSQESIKTFDPELLEYSYP